jgi:enterochelin esterase-like enzyme
VARDLVEHVNRTYRVRPEAAHRAIGGLSMGGTGALLQAFARPELFSVVGAHSPSLPEEGARPFLGTGKAFAQRDAISLASAEVGLGQVAIWIDVGDEDVWLPRAEELHQTLTARRILHEWHIFPGDHWGPYWAEHIPDYLRFYDKSLKARG